MDLALTGKLAVIVGGSRGIGRAIAHELAIEGCNVAIAARNDDLLNHAASELRAATGREVTPLTVDTQSRRAVEELERRISTDLGGADILVNAAGVPGGLGTGPLESVTDEAVAEDLDTKFIGYLRCARAFAPLMKQRGWGRMIHIGGLSARESGLYSTGARNLAIVHLSKTLSDELGPFGITSNVVHPGATRTEWLVQRLDDWACDTGATAAAMEEQLASTAAIRRIIEPHEVAYLVAFLASPKADAITGEVIAAGGGRQRGVTM
jgi:NAD(P)-dependent dehydrogenase (short-subunit alcohol dehydrogenase family)